jgi:hypothetical protein
VRRRGGALDFGVFKIFSSPPFFRSLLLNYLVWWLLISRGVIR